MQDTRKDGDAFSAVALRDFQDTVRRRSQLFLGVTIFLTVDAIAFFVGLIWASWTIASGKGDWHLYATALLPGALGAVVVVMTLKAVYRVPDGEGPMVDDLAPGYRTLRESGMDLSGD